MKKIMALVLIFVMCFTFVACEASKSADINKVKEAVEKDIVKQLNSAQWGYGDSGKLTKISGIVFDSVEEDSKNKYKVTGKVEYYVNWMGGNTGYYSNFEANVTYNSGTDYYFVVCELGGGNVIQD